MRHSTDCSSSSWTQFEEVVRAFCSGNTVSLMDGRAHLILWNLLADNGQECQTTSNFLRVSGHVCVLSVRGFLEWDIYSGSIHEDSRVVRPCLLFQIATVIGV